MSIEKNTERIELLDVLRGLSIILMVFYHFGYDLVMFNLLPREVLYNPLLNVLQPFFAGLFIMISGISSRFSHSNLKRGIIMLMFGMCVTAVTILFTPTSAVMFGILHFLGIVNIIYAGISRYINRIPSKVAPFIHSGMLIVWFALFQGYRTNIPHLWWLGLPDRQFTSADYFPIFPWIFVYLLGTWLGKPIREKRMPEWFYNIKNKPLATVGRYTLWIYLLHQPVVYALTVVIDSILKTK